VKDADGNVYHAVRIGNQVWTVENLRTTKYNDGTAIPLVADSADWYPAYDSSITTPAYCYYNNTANADSIRRFGALYNWYAISSTNPKKIAPTGWHVPKDADWDTLQNHLIANGYNWDTTTTGNKIAKALASKTDWLSDPNPTDGMIGKDLTKNNFSGFSALPGGYRYYFGNFLSQSSYGSWWSATENDASDAYYRSLDCSSESLSRTYDDKSCGFSVRLLRD
jgi:uncharacterized protein (TIGR02145 family)